MCSGKETKEKEGEMKSLGCLLSLPPCVLAPSPRTPGCLLSLSCMCPCSRSTLRYAECRAVLVPPFRGAAECRVTCAQPVLAYTDPQRTPVSCLTGVSFGSRSVGRPGAAWPPGSAGSLHKATSSQVHDRDLRSWVLLWDIFPLGLRTCVLPRLG